MELESDDDDKENDALVEKVWFDLWFFQDLMMILIKENGGVTEEDDIKERSHIMEELWEGGGFDHWKFSPSSRVCF